MRLLHIAAFVNELNFKNVTAFFTSAFVRKTTLNKEPLFCISALVFGLTLGVQIAKIS